MSNRSDALPPANTKLQNLSDLDKKASPPLDAQTEGPPDASALESGDAPLGKVTGTPSNPLPLVHSADEGISHDVRFLHSDGDWLRARFRWVPSEGGNSSCLSVEWVGS